ncbi:tRNA (adenosine(37)-N6)-threonylcarbamoyltransferase complex dimerization subunit type 1 TsaB [Alkalilimnicola sp. S0819]|uniref:tRNA (adenosine(37)-N6)-threonylcarbamoyltransferase complex dimerization subunit type 1 TsaB n=1 Tax=Alkalilimnicola sp. S0819 TaxID=2613922 RepID=UPI001262262D|nr:tRNA (adenosine(37)-N6)-threonylcarbamoyltransferase complex dimerization subunit type 1 TsaB [Alkalilimnicola sp. S0819]KAB7627225.1 tRNA (adenosine(37)-N6)-threonylcarbamoyltransferase complex dimerization subunit type 1 TsaB [Alkalilimnicola sp. S0819]MPQ15938.1 tRNA (adenosine(37)-N6)-threonylcarbamoyltransferase complex dimerization subunit type 1 TsaB [Alkalilimnicola sp. S0819]
MTQSVLLALDTATEACSAALSVGGETRERYALMPRGHAEHVLAMVRELLAEAELTLAQVDLLAFGRGPGSFTGVRIGAGVAQGLAYSVDLPVAPVSTLAMLAQGAARAHGAERVLAAVDARMAEVYWGAYRLREGVMELLGEERVLPPQAAALPETPGWFAAGTGWARYPEELGQRFAGRLGGVDGEALPRALDALPLAARLRDAGALVGAAQALPVYLRDRVTR